MGDESNVPSGAWAIDVELALTEVDRLAPVGDLHPVGRLVADLEQVRARFGDPAALPGGTIELATPSGRARISWDARVGMWIVAGDSVEVMAWVSVALTESTAGLASGGAGDEGAAAEDVARQLTAAYAVFTSLRDDDEHLGDELGLQSQRESMADELWMAVDGPGLAERLDGLVEGYERGQVAADAEEGVEVDYSMPIETVRKLAALAAGG
jgi:hypothetical protein